MSCCVLVKYQTLPILYCSGKSPSTWMICNRRPYVGGEYDIVFMDLVYMATKYSLWPIFACGLDPQQAALAA